MSYFLTWYLSDICALDLRVSSFVQFAFWFFDFVVCVLLGNRFLAPRNLGRNLAELQPSGCRLSASRHNRNYIKSGRSVGRDGSRHRIAGSHFAQ